MAKSGDTAAEKLAWQYCELFLEAAYADRSVDAGIWVLNGNQTVKFLTKMVKLDLSDRYGGKGGRYRLLNHVHLRDCCTICKRYFILAGCAFMVVVTIAFIYCTVWVPDSGLWCNKSKRVKAIAIDSFILMRDQERAAYERLMRYILNPQAPCLTSKVFGGKTRKNRKLDGDKVICLEPGPGIGEKCLAYSFGIANEWSFDESIHQEFGCEVFSFDPSMGFDDHVHSPGIYFYNLGIGEFDGTMNVNGQEWKIKALDSILQQLGHRNKTIDVLKIDIEGAEYVVLEDILEKGLLSHVNHLCIEIHLPDNPYWTRVLKLLTRIEAEAGLRHFSTRNNTQMPAMRVPGFYSRYEQHFFEMAWYRH